MQRYTDRNVWLPGGLSATMPELDAQNQAEVDSVAHLSTAEVLEQLTAQHERMRGLELDPDTT